MKNISILVAVVVVVIAATNIFVAQDVVTAKKGLDECLDLETRLIEAPDPSSADLERVEQCNEERRVRLGLDQPSQDFLGNTANPPAGALAHYEGLGGMDAFTVYEDRITIRSSSAYPAGETTIPFRAIRNLEKSHDVVGNIEIEYTGAHNMVTELSVSLFGPSEALRRDGHRDLDRLYALLVRQRAGQRE